MTDIALLIMGIIMFVLLACRQGFLFIVSATAAGALMVAAIIVVIGYQTGWIGL